jgi:hypothetical protein
LRSSWIIEITGLDQLRRRSEWRGVTDFAAWDSDPSVGRGPNRRRPRPCVFGATTESEDGLPKKAAAPRDWYFVRCGTIDVEALIRDRDQFWAEGLVRHQMRARALPSSITEMPRAAPRIERRAERRADAPLGVLGSGLRGVEVVELQHYLGERVELGPSYKIEKAGLLADYNAWRQAHGLQDIAPTMLGRAIRRAGIEVAEYRPQTHDGRRSRRYYRGLKLSG